VEYDALVIADGTGELKDVKLTVLLQEMFRHCKIIGAWGERAEQRPRNRGRKRPARPGRLPR
jgi:catalase